MTEALNSSISLKVVGTFISLDVVSQHELQNFYATGHGPAPRCHTLQIHTNSYKFYKPRMADLAKVSFPAGMMSIESCPESGDIAVVFGERSSYWIWRCAARISNGGSGGSGGSMALTYLDLPGCTLPTFNRFKLCRTGSSGSCSCFPSTSLFPSSSPSPSMASTWCSPHLECIGKSSPEGSPNIKFGIYEIYEKTRNS